MIIDDIALTLEKGLNSHTIAHLIECFGSAENIYKASLDELTHKAELKSSLAEQIKERSSHNKALEHLKHINKHKIKPLAYPCEDYPQLLRESYDPPHLLYSLGDTSILNRPMIAMVGTREITTYGMRACKKLIQELAKLHPEVVIVSGLAYGVDAECHRCALKSGLKTVGVVIDTLPELTPSGNQRLSAQIIADGGCILSEANIFTRKHKGEYIKRNRIMAAMTSGTVIIEAQQRGGANATARLAADYNRTVMAVPGRYDDQSSVGANEIIRTMKARCVWSGEHIMEELGWEYAPQTEEATTQIETSSTEDGLLKLIPPGEVVYTSFIVDNSEMQAGQVLAELFNLEMKGLIRSLPGGRYERV